MSGSRVGFRDEVSGVFSRLGIRFRAVGETVLRPQDLMQTVRSLAAEDLHREVPCHVVGMFSRNRELPDTDACLYGVGFVDNHDLPSGVGRIDSCGRWQRSTRPAAKHALGRRERLIARDVADDAEDHVIGDEILAMERLQVLTRQRAERVLGARARQTIRMEAVHKSIEDDIRDIARVVGIDANRRKNLVLLPRNFLRCEGGIPRDIRNEVHARLERVLHHDRVDEREIRRGTGPDIAADEVDLICNLLRAARGRPLIQQ
jgi:hypothetical protein